jgi:N-acetylglucosamine kinase-like BadF-type ATPase
MSQYFLGIDAGSSSTKWALVDESGTQVQRGRGVPVDGHLYREESRDNWISFLTDLDTQIPQTITAIYAGVTGASDFPEENQTITDIISSFFPESTIKVVMDVSLGYRANVHDLNGVYVYAGTGSISVYQDEQKRHRTVGGWGYLLGDEGAGYWIAISALREIVVARDEAPTYNQIKEIVYARHRSHIASLAKSVIELAESGDKKAIAIILSAAQHLATLVTRTHSILRSDTGPVVFGGGIARSSRKLVDEMERILSTTIEISSEDLSLEAARFAVEDLRTTN